jgi:propanol-preferring alcohol dehydrogenase
MAKTMRAVQYLGPKLDFALRIVAIPEPSLGEVRVKIASCGLCHTDLHLRDGLLDLGKRDFTVGHEIAGTIEAVGPSVNSQRIGERVVVYYYQGCEDCEYCRRGDEQLCPLPIAKKGLNSDGGYAEYVVVRARNCVPIPDSVSLVDMAPMGCAGITAIHAGKKGHIAPGDWVVVNGVGGVGFLLLQYAVAVGAKVVAIGLGAERLALAIKLGATAVVDANETGDVTAEVIKITNGGASVVFELVGKTTAMRNATLMLRRSGRIVLIGYTAEPYEIRTSDLIVREAQVLSSIGATLQDLHDVVALVAAGKIRPIIDMRLELEEFAQGLHAIESQTLVGRAIVEI